MAQQSLPEQENRVPLSRNRRAIVNVMTASAAIPQFSVDMDVDLTRLAQVRDSGQDVSVGDAVLRASALALREHPRLNASFVDNEIVEHGDVNLGVGIIGPDGLIVVVIRRADRRPLPELVAERQRLSAAAANGALRGDEVIGATFVVSNLGPAGVPRFQALLVPPAAAILAVGAARPQLRTDGDHVERFPLMTVCMTCDHRVADGLDAAGFLQTLKTLLEDPAPLGVAA